MVFGLTDELKIKVGTEKDCLQTVNVEWPAARVKEEIEKAFKSVQTQAKIPGFRPGKSPMELVKQQFQETAFARAQDNLIREGISETLKTKKINPIQEPAVTNMKFDPEKTFQFEVLFEVAPSVKATGYKGLKLTKLHKPVTDETITKRIEGLSEINARLIESTATTLANTHFAVTDYQGFLDGKPLDAGKAENFLIDMAAPQAIAGLAEGLIGMAVNEERTVPVKFPEDSPAKELAGKEALFKVTLKAIKEKKKPALDDEFAKDLGLQTFAELKEKVKQSLESESETGIRQDLEKQIAAALLEANKFSVPKSLIQDQVTYLENRLRQTLHRQGIFDADQTKLLADRKPETLKQAEKDVQFAYVMNSVAQEEKVEVTDDELKAKVEEIIAKTHPGERASYEKALNENSYRAQIRADIREKKVLDLIIASAKIKDSSGGGK